MARRVTGEEVFEQMLVPNLGKRVVLDQCVQKGFNGAGDKDTESEVHISINE